MTDARFFCTPDGGNIVVENGTIELGDGLEAAVYLSAFGGNEDDSGMDGDIRRQWWGNMDEPAPARQQRSETQYILRSLPLVPANLKRVEDAFARDLAWMVPSIASAIEVSASIPAVNTIRLNCALTVDGKRIPFSFTETGARIS
jgi:phage gp46-like protein